MARSGSNPKRHFYTRRMTGTLLAEGADNALLRRLKAGDEAAYDELVRAYAPRLLAVAQRYVGDAATAEDCVQEAFLSAFRALENFEGRSTLATWLHRITVNASLQTLRRRSARDEIDIEPLLPTFDDEGFLDGPASTGAADAETLLLVDDVRHTVRRAIDQLPVSYRSILLLRDIEGLSVKEAAEMLELSEANAKVRLHRARCALRKLLEPLLSEGSV